MKSDVFVSAQPGYRAWDIFEENGKSYATFSGEVVAWRMVSRGALVCVADAKRARDWYDLDDRFIEGSHGNATPGSR